MHTVDVRHLATLLCLAAALAACGGSDSNAAAAPANGAGANGARASGARGGDGGRAPGDTTRGGRGGRGGPGAAGGRPTQTITLAPTDVAPVVTSSIEEATPVTGDLRPIETINVRSKIEGDLLSVLVREGQRVSEGQLLARFEAVSQESAQRSAEADRVSARGDLANAQWTLEQNTQLYKAGAIAERDLKVSQQAVEAARARLAATEAKLRETSISQRDTRVLAPSAGVIDKKLVETGEHVARGTPLFSMVRNDVLELAAAVPARQANGIRIGQAVHFVADGRPFDGRVARVSPTIDPASRSITVYVQIPNPGGALKGGTFASGRVVSRTIEGATTVPTAALHQRQEDGGTYVYRIAGRTVDVAPVEVGVVDEKANKAEILSGVQAGDRVVVGNVGVLGRGMQVSIAGEGGDAAGGRQGGRGASAGGGRGRRTQ